MVWNPSPILIDLGFLQIRWYGLLFATGFFVASKVVERMFALENKPVRDVSALLAHCIIGTIIGARFGHFLFYEPMKLINQPLEVLKIWKGGLASHGAFLGTIAALYLYSKKRPSQSWLWVMDRVLIGFPLVAAFIRIGNFFNSEIIGKVTTVPWGMIFKRADPFFKRHPAQLYESFTYLIIFFILFKLYKANLGKKLDGFFAGAAITLVCVSRFVIEFFKANQVRFESELPLNMGQILSLALIPFGVWLMIRAKKKLKAA